MIHTLSIFAIGVIVGVVIGWFANGYSILRDVEEIFKELTK